MKFRIKYEQRKMSFKIEDFCITRLPVDKRSVLHEAIRLERIFESTVILSKQQFDIVKKRYHELLRRDTEIHSNLISSWDRFIDYRIRNTKDNWGEK